MVEIFRQTWFFGVIEGATAEKHMLQFWQENESKQFKFVLPREGEKPEIGGFLVRFNMGNRFPCERSPFCLSRIDQDGKVVHIYIQRERGGTGGLTFKFGTETIETTIFSVLVLIRKFMRDHSDILACPGTPLARLFDGAAPQNSYLVPDEEDP